MLTILTYALFTGLSFFAQTWWHLLICRFLAALGIGGEWAVGASLLSETWPRRWRPWIAAVLQSAVNIGVLLAMVAGAALADPVRRYATTSTAACSWWASCRRCWCSGFAAPCRSRRNGTRPRPQAQHAEPGVVDLFRGAVRRTTVLTILVCALSLTAHWAFMFWFLQHLRNLPDIAAWSDPREDALCQPGDDPGDGHVDRAATSWPGLIARCVGYRRTIALMCVAYFLVDGVAYLDYAVPRSHRALFWWLAAIGVCQGLFGLFTMYLPPLFPDAAADHRGGFLLQHRPDRGGRRDRVLRAVLAGGRPPAGAVLRLLPVPARRRGGHVPAGAARRTVRNAPAE